MFDTSVSTDDSIPLKITSLVLFGRLQMEAPYPNIGKICLSNTEKAILGDIHPFEYKVFLIRNRALLAFTILSLMVFLNLQFDDI